MTQHTYRGTRQFGCLLALALAGGLHNAQAGGTGMIAQTPLSLTQAVEPLVKLSVSNDHQLFFEAYNEYTDLTGDGVPDTTYNHDVEYYGYFDSRKCYSYSGDRFRPQAYTGSGYCDNVSGDWSGNFLNWLTMARIDTVRRMLYGGYRATDDTDTTVLERTYLPQDAHSWARYYDGDDIGRLTPLSGVRQSAPETDASTILVDVAQLQQALEDDNDEDYELVDVSGLSGFPGEPGDQIILRSNANASSYLQGYFRDGSGETRQVVVQYAQDRGIVGLEDTWTIENPGRVGVTFCNTTRSNTRLSQDVTNPPLLRVARGNYSLWSANERWQCTWQDEETNQLAGSWGYAAEMSPNSNGNIAAISGLDANTDYPRRYESEVDGAEYTVRVEVCVDGLLEDNCTRYGDSTWKPEGLLQRFGAEDELLFGLMTGSYERNKSGGVLRRNISRFSEEIDSGDGTFTRPQDSIVDALDGLRIYGYRHDDGTYFGTTGSDDCVWGLTAFDEGQCTNWGNPHSELFLEALRYFAGTKSPVFDFSGDDRMGLSTAQWDDPTSEDAYCAPMNIVQFNASTSSYDTDELRHATDLPGMGGGRASVSSWTDGVGQGEGIHGNDFFVGEVGSDNDQLCTAKSVGALGDVLGICPDEPRLGGSYQIAGLAHYAHTNDIRPDLPGAQTVTTYGVELAPAVPEISVIDGTTEVATILPACREYRIHRPGGGPAYGNCAIVDFKVVEQDPAGGYGKFFVQWEDSEQGGDYDMDMSGVLEYQVAWGTVSVTTRTFADSSDAEMGFGYVISGTTDDGFHVHSGINGYEEGLCGSDYNGCYRLDAATTQTYSLGGSAAGHLERPLFYAAKWGGFNDLNNSGTPDSTAEWARDDDETMPRTYFYATDPQALEQALAEAFTGVLAATASATSVAQNSTELQEDSLLFQARFDSDDWSGTLLAFNLDADDPTSGSPTQNLEWDAAEVMENRGHGTLVTWDDNNNTGIHFSWSALNAGQQNELSAEYDGEALLGFLSGKRDGEDTTFRARGTGPLGDIVHSDPAFAGTEDFGYAALDETGYNAFLDRKKDRPEIVYVGANDGMLHAFNAEDGEHVFGYVPNLLFPELSRLAAPDYNDHHRYFVDGSPRVADAYINDSWATVLVGTLGRGGSGVFALDVTSPGSFGPSDVLWEFDNNDLGHAIGQPAIVKLETGEWTALVHNGYDSHSNAAQLFIIDLESGDLIDRIDTGAGTGGDPNGLSQVTPVDTTGSGRADAAYAGDLHGNVWVFHLADRTVERLFTATDDGGEAQPITAAPAIATTARGDNMVFVGTGRYLSNSDIDTNYNGRPQSLYGLLDTGEGPISGRDELTEQELLAKLSVDEAVVRVTSDNDAGPRGWYLDLVYDGNYQGERIVNRPILRGRRLVVTTLIPSEHPCQFGGSGFLMELDAQSGSRPFVPVLDITGDGEFDTVTYTDDDGEEIELPPSGKRLEGIPTQPAVKEDSDDPTQEYKYIGTSSGAIEVIKEGGAVTGTRQLWRQLR